MAPIVAAAALLLGVTSHLALTWQEGRAIDGLTVAARGDEAAGGSAERLRAHLAERDALDEACR